VDPPIITVSTNYTGANADIVESQITEPLEEAINGVAGIRTLTSISNDGRSTITVEFDLGVDLEAAANDVRDKVSGAMNQLPDDVDPPAVAKADADSQPVIGISVQSNKRSLLELSDMAERVFKERLQTIPDVSEVRIWGERRYSMRLWLDPARLAAYSLTPLDVLNALNRENVELPSGRIEGDRTELTVRTMGRLRDVNEFNNMIITQDANTIVRFRDIGRAELGPENERTMLKRNGMPQVIVVVTPQPGANQIAIADAFYERIAQLKRELPEDIRTTIAFDVTEYIRASITEVQETIFLAFGLVALIVFVFLRDWRSTFIPLTAIPISLIGTFFIMYLAGFSINVLTLLGIVLAIGLVVDDAIVVLENIYVKIEEGMNPIQASLKGAGEIFFAVISTTVALAAVFMPVVFLQGLTGRLFREFGIVVAGAVIISSFVSLTLTVMLCSSMLKRRKRQPWFYRKTEPFFEWMTKSYEDSLASFMKVRWMAFVVIAVLAGFTYLLFSSLPNELAPMEDRSGFRISASGPEGATFEYMDEYMNRLTEVVAAEVPEADNVVTITSPGFGAASAVNTGFIRARLVDADKRERSQQQIVDEITAKVQEVIGARSYIIQEQTIGDRRGGLPVQYVIQAPTLEKLREVLPTFLDRAGRDPAFTFVDVNLKFNKPELRIEIDREKARSMDVSVADVSRTLQLGLSGQRFGYFIMNGKQYQVIGQVDRPNRNDPLDLRSLYVKNTRGDLIQLDNLVRLTEETTPPQLFRFNRYVSATVSASLNRGVTLGQGIEAMDAIADEVLDETYSTSLTGASREFQESSSSLLFAFILALVLIYLTLAAQFESFRDPFIIMFTVPLALFGALFSLWYFDQTMNIFSQIGIIMLIGLVTKNGILIVEFANQRKEQGLSKVEAITDAAASRFRPILMTSLATVLGILPIALALGAGSESRVSMGISVVGGMMFATFMTLYVVPAVYSYLSADGINTRIAEVEKLESSDTEVLAE
jgi:multidrug efflux pump